MKIKNQYGFTLTEIIIVLVIIAILLAVGIPMYHKHVTKMHRADGVVSLLNLSNRLEQYYAKHHSFETATIGTGNSNTDVLNTNKSEAGFYTLSILTKGANNFIIEAKPNPKQAKADSRCGTLRLNEMGQKSITGTGSLDDCWSY